MKKVLCVIRESTLRQEVESQKMDMIPFLLSKGFKENEIEWMEVQGASAIKANDVYLNYLEEVKERSLCIGCVAFWHLNRLGRQKKYITMMEAFFKTNKIQVFIKNPDLTLLDSDGNETFAASLAFSIFAVMVESETEEMLGKFKRGKELNKKNGRWNGGVVPLGFMVKDKRLVSNPKTAPIISDLYKLYIQKSTLQFIYEWLVSNGYKVAKRTINHILANPINKEIVGEDVWNEAQQVKVANTRKGKFTKKRYASNLIKCPKCGRSFLKRNENSWVCCGHTNYYRGTDGFCDNDITVNDAHLEYVLISYALFRSFNSLNGEAVIDDIERQCDNYKQQITNLYTEKQKIETKKERMATSFENGAYSKETYIKRLAAANKDIEKLNTQIRDMMVQIDILRSNATPQVEAERIKDLLDIMTYEDIYVAVHKYIKVGYVYSIENGRWLKIETNEDEDINIAFVGKGAGVKILYNKCPHKDGEYDISEWTDITRYYKDNDIEVFGKL